jgi:hypothetical protein
MRTSKLNTQLYNILNTSARVISPDETAEMFEHQGQTYEDEDQHTYSGAVIQVDFDLFLPLVLDFIF